MVESFSDSLPAYVCSLSWLSLWLMPSCRLFWFQGLATDRTANSFIFILSCAIKKKKKKLHLQSLILSMSVWSKSENWWAENVLHFQHERLGGRWNPSICAVGHGWLPMLSTFNWNLPPHNSWNSFFWPWSRRTNISLEGRDGCNWIRVK